MNNAGNTLWWNSGEILIEINIFEMSENFLKILKISEQISENFNKNVFIRTVKNQTQLNLVLKLTKLVAAGDTRR